MMNSIPMALFLEESAKRAAFTWLYSLGGFGLILLAFLDNSVVPLPGSMDLLTIVLTAHHAQWWWYYALMATIGGMLGAYPTYRLGQKGGKASLEKKVSPERLKKVYGSFERYGSPPVLDAAARPLRRRGVPDSLGAGAYPAPVPCPALPPRRGGALPAAPQILFRARPGTR